MRVALVNCSDAGVSGAQIQVGRLIAGFHRAGIETRLFCRERTRRETLPLPTRKTIERLLRQFTQRLLGLNDVHCVSSFRLPEDPAFRECDVVDFHGIHWDTFSYLALPRITKEKPAVLTLHDMWAFTGHCHASLECDRWRTGCGRCPHPQVAPAIRRDSTRLDWRLKRWSYQRSRLAVVAPSRWMAGVAREGILGRFQVHRIPHGIDTDVYRPLDPAACRSMLDVPPGKQVVLFAVDDLTNRIKGGDLIVKAIRALPARVKDNLVFLLMGRNGDQIASEVEQPVKCLGYVKADPVKAMVYSAADVFVHPTRADSFGLTVLESLACGTPVVSFRVGGIPDMVQSRHNGFLAEPDDAEGLARGIAEVLAPEDAASLRQNSREVVLREFRIEQQAARYAELYHSLIETTAAGSLAEVAAAAALR
jgi:glycosyltransferase involved in cell wall biosynthesis